MYQKKAASDEPVAPVLTIEQEALLQDAWLASWFKSEPSLKNENLQPYYYFSRDRLSVSGTHLQRMSPSAQEVFRKITADGESVINLGIDESKALSIGDASAVFEALTEKINQQDKQTGDNPVLKRLFDFCAIRTELISQILIFVEKLPELILPLGVTTWLMEATKNTAYVDNATKLLTKWSKSTTNTALAKMCATKLKQN